MDSSPVQSAKGGPVPNNAGLTYQNRPLVSGRESNLSTGWQPLPSPGLLPLPSLYSPNCALWTQRLPPATPIRPHENSSKGKSKSLKLPAGSNGTSICSKSRGMLYFATAVLTAAKGWLWARTYTSNRLINPDIL
ncbi:hypothetical protein TCAL_16568 [Tigriopus californicus]|uniref:Uncharacterized protein n=1 Tax=Tigriopus californicus TaxID=6832 RepID=A0A553NE05_TIGCA|nr:hypothetical protein TCAL_16568 [Tigriopus californicus]